MLSSVDVVRHRLVSDIVDAYARWDAAKEDQATSIRAASGDGMPGRSNAGSSSRAGHPGHPGRGARRR
jgi:phosphate starvation-inducible PhoH-like protein